MKRISILGSTGSIGINTLNVIRHLGEGYQVTALAAHSNIDLLEQQVLEYRPTLVAVYDQGKARELQIRLPHIEVIPGLEGLKAVATQSEANLVVSAMAGTIGLVPTLAAIEAGKDVGLANKEALVSGGGLVMSAVAKNNVRLIPIDSEHSAIFQCLNGEDKKAISKIILTTSGGAFRNFTIEQMQTATVDQALCHPTWKMGPKVTIDASTLMNKGLEVIEAYWLFGIPLNQIEVIVHPQSIIHSMVEFVDNSIIAQMGETSMIVPIQYALTYPKRMKGSLKPFDFVKYSTLQFLIPDRQKFKCLGLAYEALQTGGTLPCYMNAANEVLVNRFLSKQITWLEIASKLQHLMERHSPKKIESLDLILAIDQEARLHAHAV